MIKHTLKQHLRNEIFTHLQPFVLLFFSEHAQPISRINITHRSSFYHYLDTKNPTHLYHPANHSLFFPR